ncbi:MAG: hypothetical protein KC609_15900 [Myxococcales bacterium]|nr:hypothetical protein [Myxococcales bacterium]
MAERKRFFSAKRAIRHLLGCTLVLIWMGNCAGNGCEGCGGLGNPNYKFPRQRAITGVVEARITQPGFDFIAENLKTLIGIFFKVDANGVATIPLSSLGLGNVDVLDFGLVSASLRDLVVTIDFTQLTIELVENSSPARIRVRIDNASVGLKDGTVAAEFLFGIGDAGCKIANGVDVGQPTERITKLTADLFLIIAVDSDKRINVSTQIQQIDLQDMGVKLEVDCNVAECLDGKPQGSTSECGECQTLCPLADFGASVASGIQGLLKNQINALLTNFGDFLVKTLLDATINDKTLELEGELNLASFLQGFLPSVKRALPLGFLISPGANGIIVNGTGNSVGLDLKLDGGLDSTLVHGCVPPVESEPTFNAGTPPFYDGSELDAQGNPFTYHVGLGISAAFINQAVWAAYKSGLLCIALTTDDIHRISDGKVTLTAAAFDLILPGFRQISSTKAPLLVEIHPRIASTDFPVVQLQDGDKLLRLRLKNSGISLFTTIENRTARVFQVNADLDITLGLTVLPDNSLQVDLGTIDVKNVQQVYNELFAGAKLEEILSFVLDLATSYLLKNGLTFDLDIDQLATQLVGLPVSATVHDLKADGAAKDWLSIFVSLKLAGTSGLTFKPTTQIRALDLGSLVRYEGRRALPTGELRLAVEVPGVRRDLEYQVRVDGGMWRTWQRGPKLRVRSARLYLQSRHTIEVRSRLVGEPKSLERTPVSQSFYLDLETPTLRLRRVGDRLVADVDESVTAAADLLYSYRVDGAPFCAFSRGQREIDLRSLPSSARRVEMRVKDGGGNIALASYTLEDAPLAPSTAPQPRSGCQASEAGDGPLVPALLIAAVGILFALLRRRGVFFFAGASLIACALVLPHCTRTNLGPIPCENTSQCPSHYVCAKSKGYCIAARSCTRSEECCPGQKCFSGLCTDAGECDQQNACVGDDKTCIDGICRRTSCSSNSDCTFPNRCLGGYCLVDLPCNGRCGDEEACVTPLDLCVSRSQFCGSTSCQPGQVLVVANAYAQIGAICEESSPSCECITSPELPPGKYGAYARIAIDRGTTPVIAAYDKTYGDLVLLELNVKQQPVALRYIDGIPPDGRVVYDPKGPRGGIVDPGDDVGLEPAIVTGPNGYIAISYYDRTHKSLKLAYRSAVDQPFTILTLDQDQMVGRYSSLTIDAQSRLHLAYFVELDQNGETGIRYARSDSLTPTDGSQFTGTWVKRIKRPNLTTPCNSSCLDDEACIEKNGAQVCRTLDSTPCSPFCGPGSVCVDGDCVVELRPLPETDRIPVGIGLYTSIAVRDQQVYLAYYDSIEGNLLAARGNLSTGFTSFVIDGASPDGTDTGDIGRFAHLVIAPSGTIGIAYQDTDNGYLLYWSGTDLENGTIEVVDDGSNPLVRSLVGADARLLFGPDGQPRIAYQDATFNDVKYARYVAGSWQLSTLAEDGALGYYVDQVSTGKDVLVSYLEIALDAALQVQYTIRVLIVPYNR